MFINIIVEQKISYYSINNINKQYIVFIRWNVTFLAVKIQTIKTFKLYYNFFKSVIYINIYLINTLKKSSMK